MDRHDGESDRSEGDGTAAGTLTRPPPGAFADAASATVPPTADAFDDAVRPAAPSRPPQQFTTGPRPQKLSECQTLIGYTFRDVRLLESALTHASSADSRVVSNERLEFLGDSILGLVICEHVFNTYPSLLEGELTKIKSVVVSRRTCARASRTLGMERFMFVGRGMTGQAAVPQKIMADVFEALIGAIHLDGGLDAARPFILRYLRPEVEKAADGNHGGNYKSMLQQFAQREYGATPVYQMLDARGPDHAKHFKVMACIAERRYPAAWGATKKEAEQRSALNAIKAIEGEEPPYACD